MFAKKSGGALAPLAPTLIYALARVVVPLQNYLSLSLCSYMFVSCVGPFSCTPATVIKMQIPPP